MCLTIIGSLEQLSTWFPVRVKSRLSGLIIFMMFILSEVSNGLAVTLTKGLKVTCFPPFLCIATMQPSSWVCACRIENQFHRRSQDYGWVLSGQGENKILWEICFLLRLFLISSSFSPLACLLTSCEVVMNGTSYSCETSLFHVFNKYACHDIA